MMYPEIQPGGRLGRLVFLPGPFNFATRARYQGMFSEAEVLEYWNKDITRCHEFPVEMCMAKVITWVVVSNPKMNFHPEIWGNDPI